PSPLCRRPPRAVSAAHPPLADYILPPPLAPERRLPSSESLARRLSWRGVSPVPIGALFASGLGGACGPATSGPLRYCFVTVGPLSRTHVRVKVGVVGPNCY